MIDMIRAQSTSRVLWMAAVVGPAGGGGVDIRVLQGTIRAVGEEKLNHRAMTIERRVMQARAG